MHVYETNHVCMYIYMALYYARKKYITYNRIPTNIT